MNLDFPAIMVLLVAVTGGIWAIDSAIFAPKRRARAGAAAAAMPLPIVVEYARSFFPVFLVVLLLRSFAAEPFRIPSNSMMPTLLTGDFILVNKFTYGIRLPVLDRKIIEIGSPQRGDVMVFKSPTDAVTPFIKRVIGVPGDEIRYENKTLYLNGKKVVQDPLGEYTGTGSGAGMSGASLRQELLEGAPHEILVREPRRAARQFTDRGEGQWVVPAGHYFMMGDNRDNSHDSRFWGFVPDQMIVGKAFAIWFNWDWGHGIDFGRIGGGID